MSLVAVLAAALAITPAGAQVQSPQVQNGDIYLPTGRLTHDGQVSEAVMSNDRQLVAYVRKNSDLYVCDVPGLTCVMAVKGRNTSPSMETNLTDISNVRFSLQAGAGQNGTLNGSVFFLADVGQAGAFGVHRVTLQGKTLQQITNSPSPFITYAASLEVLPA